ncbi:MAG: shikimate dehydrogenase [Candidatus Omnitrophica bacterium]|nr:shikimate dehydrogenase [Candidatus Omnitrophota bacterium]
MAKELYGIIGYPVKHSLSPVMQNAAFSALGMEAEYSAYEVPPAGLDAFLRGLESKKIAGLNITIPHKIAAKGYVERHGTLDENARRLGAINTIKVIDGKPNGFNTDGAGFYRSLVEDLKFAPEGRRIFILGAGGAATAIAMYLGNGPKTIAVTDIDAAKLEGLRSHYRKFYDEKRFRAVGPADAAKALSESDLLINATPVGMKESDPLPVDAAELHAGLYVYDIIYNLPATGLVKEATKKKLHAVTGLGMLLYQGVIAFEIWTGKKAPVDVMRKALREAIRSARSS